MRVLQTLIFLFTMGFASYAIPQNLVKYNKKTIKVAVIDTGFDFSSTWKGKKGVVKPKLCNYGHKDLTGTGYRTDNHGHGTHVAGLIAKYAGKANYCLVIIKYYDPKQTGRNNVKNTVKAFQHAINIGVDMINYSGGGSEFNYKEYVVVKKALDKGIVFVAAAGNDNQKIDYHISRLDIKYARQNGKILLYSFKPYYINRNTGVVTDKTPLMYYPASYDPRIIAVKNIDRKGERVSSSNYGKAFIYQEVGDNVLSLLPNNKVGHMTGTSQAAPTKAGKILKLWGSK
jgi:subtilisin family serine protease